MGDLMRVREPAYGEFGVAEYIDRVQRARALMDDAGMDAMLLTNAKLIRYFAGGPLTGLFDDTFNAFFCLLPADPKIDAALLMSSGREGCSQTSWVPDQRFWGYDEDASLMDQDQVLGAVAEAWGITTTFRASFSLAVVGLVILLVLSRMNARPRST